MKKERVLIIGGGFGGLSVAKKLANSRFDVTLVDKKNHHLFQPLLYQVASAALSPADIAVPLREVLSEAKNISVFMEDVLDIDKKERSILCKSGNKYFYDYLIVATGSIPNFYGVEEFKKNAIPLKNLNDALSIRQRILKSFEECERNKGLFLNFVIIGAGPTGVELAGAFAEISYEILINDFKNFDPGLSKIYLIEGGKEVLPSFSGSLSVKAKKYLEQLGVEIIAGELVKEIKEDYLIVGDKKIFSNNIIWAAGNKTSPLCKKLEVAEDKQGRVIVNSDLSVPGHENIFVIGDSAHFKNKNGESLPGLAPVASQQGKHLAKNLLKSKRLPFKYFDKGSMATIGKFKAVMKWKSFKSAGAFAWLSWCFVHILFLIKFRNKLSVFTHWAWEFIFNKRGVRLISKEEE